MSTPQTDPIIGAQFGSCVVEVKVAVGGFATIYRAMDTNLGIPRAVKIFHSHLSGQAEFAARLSTEMQVLATLDHPNIVKIAFAIDEPEVSGFVMEFVDGETLNEMLEFRGTLPLEEAVYIFEQILEAIAYAHSRPDQVIHRDLTPDNVMVKPDGTVKIMDFGISKTLRRRNVTQTGIVLGKPLYMAPEQFEGDVTVFADQYALGVILYEMLTGILPFEGDSPIALYKQHLEEEVRLPRHFMGKLPGYVEKSIFKAMAKDPGKRFLSVHEFLEVLKTRRWPEASGEELKASYEAALLAFRRHDLPRSVEILQQILSVDPTHEEARRLMDSCSSNREEAEHVDRADKAFRAALAAHARRAARSEIRDHLARFLDAAANVPEVRSVRRMYRDARRKFSLMLGEIRQNPVQHTDEVQELMEAGKSSIENEDFQKAAQLFDRVLSIEENIEARKLLKLSETTMRVEHMGSLFEDGITGLMQEDYQRAMVKMEQVLRIHPDHPQASRTLELAREGLARRQAAERQRLARHREVARLFEEGVKHLENWDYSEAAVCFRQVLALQEDHAQARELLDEAQSRLHDVDRMEEISLFYEEGMTFFRCNKFSESLACFDKVLELFPDHRGAVEYRQRAIGARDQHQLVETLVGAGIELFKAGSYPQALGKLEAALELEKGHREALKYRRLSEELERLQTAERAAPEEDL